MKLTLTAVAALLLASSVATACPPQAVVGSYQVQAVQQVQAYVAPVIVPQQVYVPQQLQVQAYAAPVQVQAVQGYYGAQAVRAPVIQRQQVIRRQAVGAPAIDIQTGILGRIRRVTVN